MEDKVKRILALTLVSLLITISHLHSASYQQQPVVGSIKGRIVGKDKQPIYPAVVSVEGTANGNMTNEKGEYALQNIKSGERIIVISGVGLITKKIPLTIVGGKTLELADIEVDNTIELNEVSVIGKTEARRQQEQAYAITVLDIKKAYNTAAPLSKLLNNVSSVKIREDGGTGSNFNFSLNGFSGNQVKFFLDGVPMDNFGSSFNLGNISANMAERVEVYKGVLPIGLGADALGGAVNIITRKDANYLDASYSVGSFNTHKVSVNGAYTQLKTGFTVRTNAFYNYSDNNYKVWVPIQDLNTGKMGAEQWVKRFHDTYKGGGIKLETGVVNKAYADYLLAGVILSESDQDVQTGATMDAVYGGVKAKSKSMIPSVRYLKNDLFTDGLSLSLYGAYGIVNDYSTDTLARKYNWLSDWVYVPTAGERTYTDSKIENREWLANTNISYTINLHQSITFNHVFSSMHRKIHDKADPNNESNKIPQRLTKNVSGIGWLVKYDRWSATVFGKMYSTKSITYKRLDEYTENARLEKVNDNKTYFGYGAALTYFLLPKLQMKLSYEQAHRLPESAEMFGDGLMQKRNPDLKAESSDNVNIGAVYEKDFKEHTLLVESNFIYRNSKDFILKPLIVGDPTLGYKNIGKVLTKGIEGGVKYRWKNRMHAGAGVTYQNIIDNQQFEENNESFVGEGITEHLGYKSRMPNIPYFFGNANIGFNFENIGLQQSELSFDYSFNYVKKYYLSFPGFGIRDTKDQIPQEVSHDIALGYTMQKGKYSIMLECTNVGNSKLYDNYRLQKPGRAFNLKLRYFLK